MNSSITYTVGVCGCGVVGESTAELFRVRAKGDVDVVCYDKYKSGKWSDFDTLVKMSDFIFLCLPTPMNNDGSIDLSYLHDLLAEMSEVLKDATSKKIISIRSTLVPGSSDMFASQYPLLDIAVVPEFLTERNPSEDTFNAQRVVIGTPNKITFFALESLFRMVYDIDFIHLSRSEAEMYKYACNYFLGMTAMAANELYLICSNLGIDYSVIQRYLRYDSRIGSHTMVPGPDNDFGIGGKCLPKDMNALAYLAEKSGYHPNLIQAALSLNESIRKNKDWFNIKGAVTSCGYET